MNKFDEMREAMQEAEDTLRAAARLLSGRMRKVNSSYLIAQLKRELRDFNIHTGKWKD